MTKKNGGIAHLLAALSAVQKEARGQDLAPKQSCDTRPPTQACRVDGPSGVELLEKYIGDLERRSIVAESEEVAGFLRQANSLERVPEQYTVLKQLAAAGVDRTEYPPIMDAEACKQTDRFLQMQDIPKQLALQIFWEDLEFYQECEKLGRRIPMIRIIFAHWNMDMELSEMLHLFLDIPLVRKWFGVHDGVEVVDISSGELKVDSLQWRRLRGILGILAGEVTTRSVELRGGGFLDCGGGGGRFDQHGRKENSGQSDLSSIDIALCKMLPLIHQLGAMHPVFQLLSQNDKTGAAVTKNLDKTALQAIGLPFTQPTLRNTLIGLNELCESKLGYGPKKVREVMSTLLQAIENRQEYLQTIYTGDVPVEDLSVLEYHERIVVPAMGSFMIPELLNFLPDPPSDEEIELRITTRVFKEFALLQKQYESKGRPVPQGEILQLKDRVRRQESLNAHNFKKELKHRVELVWAALRLRDGHWKTACYDLAHYKEDEDLGQMYFLWRDDNEKDSTKRWVAVQDRVFLSMFRSESDLAGPRSRYISPSLMAREMREFSDMLIERARADQKARGIVPPSKKGKQKPMLAAIPQQVSQNEVAPTDVVLANQSAPSEVPLISVNEVMASVSLEDLSPVAHDTVDISKADEVDELPEVEETKGKDMDPADGDDLLVYLPADEFYLCENSRYYGLTIGMVLRIRQILKLRRVNLLSLQIRDTVERIAEQSGWVGTTEDCRFTLSTTYIDVGQIAGSIREAVAKKNDFEIVGDQCCSGQCLLRKKNGAFARPIYVADFRSLLGCFFRTNKTMLKIGLSLTELVAAIRLGMQRMSDKISSAVESGEIQLGKLPWQQKYAEFEQLMTRTGS